MKSPSSNQTERYSQPKAARRAGAAAPGNKATDREGNDRHKGNRRPPAIPIRRQTRLLRGSSASEAAALRRKDRARMRAPIPLEKIHPSLRELPRLERETMLLPYIIAEIVCREARHHVGSDVPMRYETWLVRRTRQTYATSQSFNRHLRSAAAREWLYAFLRHWLTARLIREHSILARQLPEGYDPIGIAPPVTRPRLGGSS